MSFPFLQIIECTFTCINVVLSFSKLLTEWKSCGNSSDIEKLALADNALISWLAENLMKLNEKQLIETVSVIHVQ